MLSWARDSDTEMNTDWKLLEDGNFVLFTAYLHGLKQLLVYSKLSTNIESRVAVVFGTHCLPWSLFIPNSLVGTNL